MQAVDKLDPASKKQLAGELEKSIAAPSADAGQDHGLGKQSDGKFIKPGQKFDTASGSPIAQPPANAPAAPEAPPAGGSAPTTPPAPGATPPTGTTPPAPGATPPTGTTPPAPGATPPAPGATPPTGGKLTQAQQDAMKAKLQGKRAAGQTTASQTGSGFKDYVGGSQTKLTGADAQGNPVFKKLQRESVAFSNFLGVHI
jgi:hypothetical protein